MLLRVEKLTSVQLHKVRSSVAVLPHVTRNSLSLGYMQTDFQKTESSNMVSGLGPSMKRADLSLQIPPKHTGFGTGIGRKYSPHSPGPRGGFLRALSFKKKVSSSDGERNSLLSSDQKVAPGSPLSANFVSSSNWQKCTSLPVTPASNSSPSVSTPISARTHGEQQKSHVSFFCSLTIMHF